MPKKPKIEKLSTAEEISSADMMRICDPQVDTITEDTRNTESTDSPYRTAVVDSSKLSQPDSVTSNSVVLVESNPGEEAIVNLELKKSPFYALLEETSRIKTEKNSEDKMTGAEKRSIDALRAILRDMSQLDKENYAVFVRCLLSIYSENKDIRKGAKEIIIDKRVRDGIDKYNGCWEDCLPLLKEINDVMGKDISNIATYSLVPKPHLYGCITKSGNSVSYAAASTNEKIINILKSLLVHDEALFADWVYAVLGFDSDFLEVIEERKDELTKERKKLVKTVRNILEENGSASNAVANSLLKKGYLEKLLLFFNSATKSVETEKKMRAEMDELTARLETGEEGRKRQKALIDERDATIEELSRKVRQYDKLAEELTKRLKEINDKNLIIEDLQFALNDCQEQLSRRTALHTEEASMLSNENEMLQQKLEATLSDLALKSNELERYRESGDKKESKGKQDQAKMLIQGLAEQLNYLTYFYQELKETGTLDADSIDMYKDVISEIAKVFERIGIVRISDIGSYVSFDSSMYSSMTGPMANGDKAVVTGYGWMINGEVVVKATVERED